MKTSSGSSSNAGNSVLTMRTLSSSSLLNGVVLKKQQQQPHEDGGAGSATKKKTQSKQPKPSNRKNPAADAVTTGTSTGNNNPAKDNGVAPTQPAAAAAARPAAKKNAAKQQQFKMAREKERKEKQIKNAGSAQETALQTVSTGKGVSNGSATSSSLTASSKAAAQRNELDQDSLKSRNHKLFLAPHVSGDVNGVPSWGKLAKPALSSHAQSVTERLHSEIIEYVSYTKSTVSAMAVHIEEMISNVRACVHSMWPHSQVETFGSYSTGIWLPSSDVDLVILNVVEVNDAAMTVKNLRQLATALESKSWIESVVVFETAKIPVLKLVSAETSVPIDITFESISTHSGLLARDLVKRYADELPELYPLAIVFKQLLRERDLNDAYTGGLSSYSIVLMIIHFSLLRRNGESCFQAAAIYASGSELPAPSTLMLKEQSSPEGVTESVTIKASSKSDTASSSSDDEDAKSTKSTKTPGSPEKATAPATPMSSYASIVARPKSLKRPATEGGRTLSSPSENAPVQRFSYAAVAAGVAKRDDPRVNQQATVSPPSSYAAAVAAKHSSGKTIVTPSSSAPSSVKSSPSVSKKVLEESVAEVVTSIDSVSVTSSSADTEDSSSCSSRTSSNVDSEEETSPSQSVISLGEHTMLLLEFYGTIFNYRKNGVSIRDGGYIYRLAERNGGLGKPALVIEDPIHPDRNVGASSYAFSKVVAMFEDSYYALKYFRATKFTPSALSCLLSCSGHTSHHRHHHGDSVAAVKGVSSKAS